MAKIDFRRGENVFDVGCNIGLLCMYLEERGCEVIGGELDPYIATAANMVAHITHSHNRFEIFDLDNRCFPEGLDSIMLFSVIHHTKNLEQNAAKVANACKRIVIECRPVESGRRPVAGTSRWEETSAWSYSTLEELHKGLERLFVGHRFFANHGEVDKGRYIIELRR